MLLDCMGKGFYGHLKKRGFLALTAIKVQNTMSSVAVFVRGKVRILCSDRIPVLFEKNPYMHQIYPTEDAMHVLIVFQIWEGTGEWFDLSKKPIERAFFTFGGAQEKTKGFFITDACIGCGSCLAICPQNCINTGSIPFHIQQEHCLHCGNCLTTCTAKAVMKI